jgi:MOSC domain-containing protein YiiM
MPNICAISVGKVKTIHSGKENSSQEILSAIHKLPISILDNPQSVHLRHLGVDGDEQANLKVHGGIDKAVYAYPSEHYAFWKECLLKENRMSSQQELVFGSFGENLTTTGLLETEVFIGDIWQIGSTTLQVTQFREPCFKFNIKMNYSGAAKKMAQTGYSGWYLSVLKPGMIKAGDQIQVTPGKRLLSIAAQSQVFYQRSGQTQLDF